MAEGAESLNDVTKGQCAGGNTLDSVDYNALGKELSWIERRLPNSEVGASLFRIPSAPGRPMERPCTKPRALKKRYSATWNCYVFLRGRFMP